MSSSAQARSLAFIIVTRPMQGMQINARHCIGCLPIRRRSRGLQHRGTASRSHGRNLLGAGTGDNAASALGSGAVAGGVWVVSLGTSGASFTNCPSDPITIAG